MCVCYRLRSRVFTDKESMMVGAMEIAGEIAGRSPVAVQGTKINLLYSRDHSVAEGLDYMVRFCQHPSVHSSQMFKLCLCERRSEDSPVKASLHSPQASSSLGHPCHQ